MNGELEFEKPIVELERKLEELKKFSEEKKIDLSEEIAKLEREIETTREKIFRNLNPWQRTLLARHPRRPYTLDYVRMIMRDFVALAGDRLFGEDEAIVGGLARFEDRTVVVIGHQKGRDTKENLRRNFGMPHPEGYRKAMRLMKLAEKFHFPVITFIDTPGAYPGIGAEERGQAEA
ncbi:MAG: acetyl-CoA carboxylase carboxyl transferase subunit alpha, partial [Deltaproteobacteria bacterium]